MKLPYLQEFSASEQATTQFGGYNHNDKIADNEFYDMRNMTSKFFPALAPREARGTYATPLAANGLIAKDSICYVDGSEFVVGSTRVSMGLTSGKKTLTSFGAYVIIMPDAKYINTADTTDNGSINASFTTSGAVKFEMARVDGTAYTVTYTQASKPENPNNGEYWIDTSAVPHTLKQYSATSGMWSTVPTTYVKITCTNIGKNFAKYDGINLSGLESETGDLSKLSGSFVIYDSGDDYIVVTGFIDQTTTQAVTLTVARSMPVMDFIIESQNRLWGCRYGLNAAGDFVNEIYCSKLGDFKNWNCFMGLSTDSYVASCGTDGKWTGAISYMGIPHFFKENALHKVYGNYPANFQIQDTALTGVQEGSARSLSIVNGVLFYKSRLSVCYYDGSMPVDIGEQFGGKQYDNASACGYGTKYYITMHDGTTPNLFVFDTARRMWHKEDDTIFNAADVYKEVLYYINAEGKIKMIGSQEKDTERFHWSAETGFIDCGLSSKKYVSKIILRMSLALGTYLRVYIQYDSLGDWEHISAMNGTSLKSFSFPIRPKRCDHFRLRFEGYGDLRIFSMSKILEAGSDM